MNIAYVRVSTIDQNPGRQYEDLKNMTLINGLKKKHLVKILKDLF